MSGKDIQALFLGDICGQPGNRAVFMGLKQLIKDYRVDVVIANGENASDGFGITPEEAEAIFAAGVDIITTGNHIWQRNEIYPMLNGTRKIIRPANYPPGVPGKGVTSITVKGVEIVVINLQGRLQMSTIDCPFRIGKELIQQVKRPNTCILIDFHAESTEEKEALALYLDGTAAAVVGTHTHIQTADERILPKGTAYITDIGMTGPVMSVIGSEPEISIKRQLTQIPLKNHISDTPAALKGVVITINSEKGLAKKIVRFSREMGV
ncbi:MAG: TIGR00282 family metallophosphoesterase [Bacteroidetes bacterium]|nr:TIGR00282 family metallophosphoesterase [Bacteroidota bacterium]